MIEGILMLAGILILLLLIYIRTSYIVKKRGWKIKTIENGSQMYSELDKDNNWRTITFDCEMYSKDVPRHALIINKKPAIGIITVPAKKRIFYSYGVSNSFELINDGPKN